MKIKLGIIFGGMSTENEVSVQSAKSIMKELNKEKYEIFPIYIFRIRVAGILFQPGSRKRIIDSMSSPWNQFYPMDIIFRIQFL